MFKTIFYFLAIHLTNIVLSQTIPGATTIESRHYDDQEYEIDNQITTIKPPAPIKNQKLRSDTQQSICMCGGGGIPGVNGIPGQHGRDGQRGRKGDKGDQGVPGVHGTAGIAGTDGTPGSNGLHGLNGFKGLKGDPGIKGHKGNKGDSGGIGIPGITAEKGSKGDKGEYENTQFLQIKLYELTVEIHRMKVELAQLKLRRRCCVVNDEKESEILVEDDDDDQEEIEHPLTLLATIAGVKAATEDMGQNVTSNNIK